MQDTSTLPQQDSTMLRQCIMQCIAAKNAADRTKNYWSGTSTKDAREKQIRDVLQSILQMPNLADYKVTSLVKDNISTGWNKAKQGYASFSNRYQRPNPSTMGGPTTMGGRRRRRMRQTRKHR